jgi:hypothetical protein
MNTEKLVAIAGTYLRAAIAAVLALYLAGESNPKNLLMAAIASVAAPILKALDPTEAAYGKGSE